jgi:hypothetical protein
MDAHNDRLHGAESNAVTTGSDADFNAGDVSVMIQSGPTITPRGMTE